MGFWQFYSQHLRIDFRMCSSFNFWQGTCNQVNQLEKSVLLQRKILFKKGTMVTVLSARFDNQKITEILQEISRKTGHRLTIIKESFEIW